MVDKASRHSSYGSGEVNKSFGRQLGDSDLRVPTLESRDSDLRVPTLDLRVPALDLRVATLDIRSQHLI